MEKALIVADPKTPRDVLGNGANVPAGHSTCGNKPAILEVGVSAEHKYPNSPSGVLKDAVHIAVRQFCAALAVDRNLTVLPSIQTVRGANPNATIPGR